MSRLILGSGSPRRADLMRQIGLDFSVLSPDIDETAETSETARDYVERMALNKADAIRERIGGNDPVLCADTTVALDGQILGKPEGHRHGIAMLQALSGRVHEVISAVVVSDGRVTERQLVETIVRFRPLTLEELEAYWSTGEPVDKAGSYGIQGLGAVFVESITGSYSNVVGLPLTETALMLRAFGIDCLAAGTGSDADEQNRNRNGK